MADARPATIRAVWLGRELRRLREREQATLDEIAAPLGWSTAKLSRVEGSKSRISVPDLNSLLDMYEVTPPHRGRLVEFARTAAERGWWEFYIDDSGSAFARYLGLENEAVGIDSFRLNIVYGLLQTRDYAAEILDGRETSMPPGEVSRRVDLRMRRQELLSGEDPLTLRVVMDESALRRRTDSVQAMKAQLDHLLEMSERENITIQVLPFVRGIYPVVASSFSILKFADESILDTVYAEQLTGSIIIDREQDVHAYNLAIDRISRSALTVSESRDLILRTKRDI